MITTSFVATPTDRFGNPIDAIVNSAHGRIRRRTDEEVTCETLFGA